MVSQSSSYLLRCDESISSPLTTHGHRPERDIRKEEEEGKKRGIEEKKTKRNSEGREGTPESTRDSRRDMHARVRGHPIGALRWTGASWREETL